MFRHTISLFILSVISFLGISVSPLFAASSQTSIETSSSGNSASTVSVITESSSNTKTQTDIVIETNGKKQEYHSGSGEDVTLTSEDGKTIVKVENSGSQKSPVAPSSSPKPSTPPKPSPTGTESSESSEAARPENQHTDAEPSDQSFFAVVIHWLIDLL